MAKYFPRLFAISAVVCLALPQVTYSQATAIVDLNTRYQTFEGWGTSLAWWANVVGGYPEPIRSEYIRKFFDPVSGLGLNIVRYNIGGGENPAFLPPNRTFLEFRARVPGFAATAGQYDWAQDANQRYVLTEAVKKGVNIEEAFSNSPPYWMTVSGSVSGGVSASDNLRPESYSAFADYLTTVVQHFHDAWGITFRTVTALNEPASGYWHFGNRQEGCGFSPVHQNEMVKQLGASLAKKGMTYTSVSGPEETNIDASVSSFATYDSTARSYLSQVNTHTYQGTQRIALQAAAAAAGKRLWMSEVGDGDGTGLKMADGIIADLREMKANAWIYWQTVDNGPGWGLFANALDGTANYGYTVNRKYYSLAQFSKFIRPGYQVIAIGEKNSVAAYDGKANLILVTLSQDLQDQNITYQVDNLPTGSWLVTPYRTSATESLVQLLSFPLTGNRFGYLIEPSSLTTFVITKQPPGTVVAGRGLKLRKRVLSAETE